ncbi:MAG: MarR family EPS-associated transcriptional regulator [Mariprofundales bacterium]|nr:MarR family EPS-associated transcriptional regulator [Mariprofundales bacterium]
MTDRDIDSTLHYHLLKVIDQMPDASQRQLAAEIGVSLGKINYCLKALMQKGVVKVRNFSGSKSKRAYAYYLTPDGMRVKARLTRNFFRRVEAEYVMLKREVEQLPDEDGQCEI